MLIWLLGKLASNTLNDHMLFYCINNCICKDNMLCGSVVLILSLEENFRCFDFDGNFIFLKN